MTEYLKSEPFSVYLGTQNYRNNWDLVFKKKDSKENNVEEIDNSKKDLTKPTQ